MDAAEAAGRVAELSETALRELESCGALTAWLHILPVVYEM